MTRNFYLKMIIISIINCFYNTIFLLRIIVIIVIITNSAQIIWSNKRYSESLKEAI